MVISLDYVVSSRQLLLSTSFRGASTAVVYPSSKTQHIQHNRDMILMYVVTAMMKTAMIVHAAMHGDVSSSYNTRSLTENILRCYVVGTWFLHFLLYS